LEHVVSRQGIECDPEIVAAIATRPTPTSIAEVRTFCGLASYYRTFVYNFAAKAKPLHNLTCKGATISWTLECETAFQERKQALTSTPILVAPCNGGQYVLDTDASDTALGAVLQQEQGNKLHVIGYASQTLSPSEARYCITRRELLGVVFGLKKYRQYLLGQKIIVRTDHAALAFLMKTPEPIGQQGRWLDLLGEYDITIQHRPGQVHGNSDALLRRSCERSTETSCQQCPRATQALADDPIACKALLVNSSIELPVPICFKPLYSQTDKSSDLSTANGTHDFASDPLEALELPVSPDEATHASPTNDVTARAQVLGVTADPASISMDKIRDAQSVDDNVQPVIQALDDRLSSTIEMLHDIALYKFTIDIDIDIWLTK